MYCIVDYYHRLLLATRSPVGVAISVLQAYAEDEKNFEQVVQQAANQIDKLLHSSKLQSTLLLLQNNVFKNKLHHLCQKRAKYLKKNNFISFLNTFLHLEDEQNGLKKISTILDNFSSNPNFFNNLIFNRSSKFQVF